MQYHPGLYIVATPIGNLGDITLRAIQTLQNSNYILCEDTRVAKKLLQKYAISAKLMIYNDHSDDSMRQKILALIGGGNVISLISDAGTPLIADPGYKLVEYLRKYQSHIDTTPGPCSVIAALSLAGMPTDRFIFLGFVPKTINQKIAIFQEFVATKATLVFFETAPRIVESLQVALQELGNRDCSIVREITKIHQEVISGKIQDLLDAMQQRPQLKGEIVLLISQTKEVMQDSDIITKLRLLTSAGFSKSDAAKIVASLFVINKNKAYKLLLHI